MFEGPHLGYMPTLKLKYWDLTDDVKFPHLETRNLMKQNNMEVVTMLELWNWLHGVEKVGVLNLLWVTHFHRAPITIFFIKKLLFMVHDGYLWLEEPIPITENLIHHISWLPYKGKDLAIISEGKGSDLAFTEAMKTTYKLEKKNRGCAITSIKDKVVHIATQILATKSCESSTKKRYLYR